MVNEIGNIRLEHADCLEAIKKMPDGSIDVICTDPPYLYLKKQKLEREFDEQLFFTECYRVLKTGSFIVLFGRGTSFYRWNTIMAEKGFDFKEEIVWNKSMCSSPLMALSRVHETVSIHVKGKGKINKVKVPYLEMKGHDLDSIVQDVKRMRSILKNTTSLNAVLGYLEGVSQFSEPIKTTHQVNVEKHIKDSDRSVKVFKTFKKGMNEKSIIHYEEKAKENNFNSTIQPSVLKSENRSAAVVRIMKSGMNEKSIIAVNKHNLRGDCKDRDRSVNVFNSLESGMNEKSIIKQVRDHYSSIHPTQKPVRLIERLLALVIPTDMSKDEIVVADFFGGSFSTMEAVHNMGLKGYCCEIDEEYYNKGLERIRALFFNSDKQIKMFQ